MKKSERLNQFKHERRLITLSITIFLAIIISLLASSSIAYARKIHKKKTVDTNAVKGPVNKSLELDFTYSSLNKESFYGFNIDYKYYPFEKYGTGVFFSFLFSGINTKDTFNFAIQKPKFDLIEIGWLNQYIFLKDTSYIISADMAIGYANLSLYDDAQRESHKGRYGKKYTRAKLIEDNNYLSISPGMELIIRTFPNGWLNFKVKYRFLIGSGDFGKPRNYMSVAYFVGMTGFF